MFKGTETAARLDFQVKYATKERLNLVQQRIEIGTKSKRFKNKFRNLVGMSGQRQLTDAYLVETGNEFVCFVSALLTKTFLPTLSEEGRDSSSRGVWREVE